MEEDRVPKKIFTPELEGTRRRGKTHEKVERGSRKRSQVLGVRRWREMVADRKKWKYIVRKAKPTVGCSANGRRWKNAYFIGFYYTCIPQCAVQKRKKEITVIYILILLLWLNDKFLVHKSQICYSSQ